jgi:hypothetical protein
MNRRWLVFLPALSLLCACTGPPHANNAKVRTEVSREITRICALPEGAQQDEIDRVRREAGITIVCPKP